jgi:hypothetical protein
MHDRHVLTASRGCLARDVVVLRHSRRRGERQASLSAVAGPTEDRDQQLARGGRDARRDDLGTARGVLSRVTTDWIPIGGDAPIGDQTGGRL